MLATTFAGLRRCHFSNQVVLRPYVCCECVSGLFLGARGFIAGHREGGQGRFFMRMSLTGIDAVSKRVWRSRVEYPHGGTDTGESRDMWAV